MNLWKYLTLNLVKINANVRYVVELPTINPTTVSKMQKRCIACNVVIGHKKHYCFRCLTELTAKAGEKDE
jgi:rRNA maturation endonuclease Nob1